MDTSDQLDDLVNRCCDAREKGEDISLTELCRDRPELRPMLERRLQGHRNHEAWEQSQEELGSEQNLALPLLGARSGQMGQTPL